MRSSRSLEPAPDAELAVADVVGPVCETGDYLAKARRLPRLVAGDLVAVLSAGAYGAVQAGTYNSRLLVPEVLVDGSDFAVDPAADRLRPADRARPGAGLAGLRLAR